MLTFYACIYKEKFITETHLNLAADYKSHHCNKHLIELHVACLVCFGEFWFCSVFLFFWYEHISDQELPGRDRIYDDLPIQVRCSVPEQQHSNTIVG